MDCSINEIQTLMKENHIAHNHVIHFKEMNDITLVDTNIKMNDLLMIKNKNVVPKYHTYTKFHYQYLYGPYHKMINYYDYCNLEEKVSAIISSYSQDKEKYLFLFDNENWLEDESIISYLTKEECNKIDRYRIVDLDMNPIIKISKKIKYLYIWNKWNHPYM
jgi:hypothetical protein